MSQDRAGNGRPDGRAKSAEMAARLDKHIDRLPEYAEKARTVIQSYRASRDVVPAGQAPSARAYSEENTRQLQRQAKLAVRERVRLQRKRRGARRQIVFWSVVALICVLFVVLNVVGATAGSLVLPVLVGVPATALAVGSGVRLRELNRRELPSAPMPLQLPPAGSSAHEPMQRLLQAQASLHELLTQLAQQSAEGVGVGADSVAHARQTAREAEQPLRSLAARIVSVERAAAATPEAQRHALDAASAQLKQQLDDGVESYGSLVAAAGHAVAAGGTGIVAAQASITDAADHLAGMAIALRELNE